MICKCAEIHHAHASILGAPSRRSNCAVRYGQVFVRNYLVDIHSLVVSEAMAGRTCAVWIVERKHARRKLFDADTAVRACIML